MIREQTAKKMPNPENLIPHRFKKGNKAGSKGRPRKFTTLLKDQGYARWEINHTIQAMLALNLEELEGILNSPDATILELTIASALKKGIGKGSIFATEMLISRVFGQPKQEVETTIIAEQPLFPDDPTIPGPYISEPGSEMIFIEGKISE
jgi:hypothetical protein